tara:strand:+ start:1005 stop:1298 length:294 start_codon:yes stop_codon:yes gene_type:complete
MKKTILTLAITAALTSGATVANAQNNATAQINQIIDYRIQQVDTNNDGVISKAEMEAKNDAMFNQTDTNNDGILTKQEMVQFTIAEMKALQAQHSAQ